MICSLIGFHFCQKCWQYGSIYPPDIPVLFLLSRQSKISFISTILKHLILCVEHINDKRPIIHVFLICIQLLTIQCPIMVYFLVCFNLLLCHRSILLWYFLFLFAFLIGPTIMRILNHFSTCFHVKITCTSFCGRAATRYQSW